MSEFKADNLTLKYWNGRGLMEVPRMMLAIAGKFPGDAYTDGRFSAPPENLDANLGRMPVIETSLGVIGQSAAINFYLATELGLMGSSSFEAAQIISISEHLKEMMTAYRTVMPWGVEPTAEVITKWFESGATDSTGPADSSQRSARFLTWWMGRLETVVGSDGFAVGSKLSLADVLIYNSFAEHLTAAELPSGTPAWKGEPFYSQEATAKALAKFPKLSAICETVASNPNAQKWLSIRGVQSF